MGCKFAKCWNDYQYLYKMILSQILSMYIPVDPFANEIPPPTLHILEKN